VAHDLADTADILRALRSPHGLYLEPGCAPPPRAPGLCITVRTTTAYLQPLAAILLGAVAERIHLPADLICDLELALHEAVANAVMHGNLELQNDVCGQVEDYGGFCAEIQRRLSDPVVGRRRVIVNAWWPPGRLCFAIGDEGPGFTMQQSAPADDKPFGRGLILMQQLARTVHWNQRRRRMILTFSLPAETAA
jgi:anti-sigma regulatory factor (Ser/Thr protein kinase)